MPLGPSVSSAPLDIVKYFYEEPVHLEALSAEADPDARRRDAPEQGLDVFLNPTPYYRGYLAGTDLAADRTGLTAIAHPEAFVTPLLDAFGGRTWTRVDRSGETTTVDAPEDVLCDPAETAVLVAATGPVDAEALAAVAAVERRYGIPALRRLLAEADVVAFPEPAHDGWDWSLFAAAPIREPLTAAFRGYPIPGVRRFVLPYRQARSEHKFYFERWQLDALPTHIEEL